MKGFIDGVNFHDLAAMKYYAPPASWTPEKKKETATNRIFSGDWIGAVKRDGAFYKFVKDEDGNMELLGRSKGVGGDYLNKIDWVPHMLPFFEALPNGTCLLGEIVAPGMERSTETTKIMGCAVDKAISRQKKDGWAKYYIFDVLAWNGESIYEKAILERTHYLDRLAMGSEPQDYIEFAEYFSGKKLWDVLQETLLNGGEGVVITREDCPYKPDKRSTKDTLKIKKELRETIDCVIMGAQAPTKNYTGGNIEEWKYWENAVTGEKMCLDKLVRVECPNKDAKEVYIYEGYDRYHNGDHIDPITKMWYLGAAGSLKIGLYKDGKLTLLGTVSGIEEEILINWKDYVGKVAEIGAMEIMDDSLRHPKFMGFRDDKKPEECTWDQLHV